MRTIRFGRSWSVWCATVAVAGVAPAAFGGDYQWSYVPVDGQTPVYTDPANWTAPAGGIAPPGAGDVAVFNSGNPYTLTVAVPSPLVHDQLKILADAIDLAEENTSSSASPLSFTLTRGDDLALQVGTASTTVDGAGRLQVEGLHFELPNGGMTASAVTLPYHPDTSGSFYAEGTQITAKQDLVAGINGGYGYVGLNKNSSASFGGQVIIGQGGGGELDLFDGSTLATPGNLVLADTSGYLGTLDLQNTTATPVTTGITIGGDVHVGGSAAGAGGQGYVFAENHTFVHAAGDWVLHQAPTYFNSAEADIEDHSDATGRNLTLEDKASVLVLRNSRFDLTQDVTLKSGSYLEVDGTSVLTFGGKLTVEPGAILDAQGTIQGAVVNAGQFEPRAGTTLSGSDFTQTADGTLLVQLTSQTSFDRLVVGGTSALAGTLMLAFDPTFTPTPGMTFDILDAGQIVGTFDQVAFQTPEPDWQASFDPSTGVVTLTQVPEPAAVGFLAAAGASMLLRRRRRRRRRRRSRG